MKKILLVGVAFATIVLAGCGVQNTPHVKTVKIGVISPLSGPASTYGIDGVNAYKYVVDAYNAHTTGVHIDLIIEDGKCDGKASTDAAQKLIQIDQVNMIMITSCSGPAVAASKVAQESKITTIVSLAVAPSISSIGDYIFRYPNGVDVGAKMATYATQHWNSISILTEETELCRSLKDVILKQYTGTIVKNISFESSEKDFSMLAKQIASSPADGLFFIAQSDATAISSIKTLADEGQLTKYKGNIVGFSVFGLPPFLKAVGNLSEGLLQYNYGAMFDLPQSGKDLLSGFKVTYEIHSDPGFVVIFAESMRLVTEAIAAGNTTSDQIKSYLTSITKGKETEGFFGPYSFDANGDVVSVPFHLQKIVNGNPEFIK